MSDSSSTRDDAAPRKPYARQMTEKRREQNRRSQKAYRERLKKRLENLEDQVSARETLDTVSASSSTSFVPVELESSSSVIDLGDAFQAAGDLCIPMNSNFSLLDIVIRPRSASPSNALVQVSPTAWPTPLSEILSLEDNLPLDSDLAGTTTPLSSTYTPSWPGASSPYLNHLRLVSETFYAATLSIASSIGISPDSYINDHISPFYLSTHGFPRPREAPTFTHLKPDLQPSQTQLRLPHPSYLDCIIFPNFRERAIILAVKGELDHFGLFMDLLNDGLVCWGGARQDGMENGVAWSMRSWEARPWFLKKWSFLVGGEDEEVWQGSRWWWSMRGEDVKEI